MPARPAEPAYPYPCNQFGGQEPGSVAEIQEFCTTAYSVTFPVFGKIDVNEGNVIRRYEPTVTPQEIRADLDPLLSG